MKSQLIDAVFRDGVLHPVQPLNLEQDAHVQIMVRGAGDSDLDEDPEPTGICTGADLLPYFGSIKDWGEDALEFQRRVRAEWDRGI